MQECGCEVIPDDQDIAVANAVLDALDEAGLCIAIKPAPYAAHGQGDGGKETV